MSTPARRPVDALTRITRARRSDSANLIQRLSTQRPLSSAPAAVEAWRLASEEGGNLFSPYHYADMPVPPHAEATCVVNPAHRPPVRDCSCGIHALRSPAHFAGAAWGSVDTSTNRGRPFVLIPIILTLPMPDQDFAHYPSGDKSVRGRSYTIRGPILTAHHAAATRLRANGYRTSVVQPLSRVVHQIEVGTR